ncbi:coiled-coil domain-containing protein 106-like isoform X3 [Entelurus aequoreus]|uniref:coiled-coil domain-containing protein 106-like isoform X3 n=1 Tax=Entelurus aequoreus TaxID=161455 RepID=UPI002B1E1E40|nr:coiled-coil domain-containing protein 106-like isoform X3 [Entelurus aequoreus]
MNPASSTDDANKPEEGLYMGSYEVSFPPTETMERPTSYHQGQQMMDEPAMQEPSPLQYSPFILVSNLRAHLYVALEKNAWLQKRVEELEEERNFLRCQLDRFIVSMWSHEATVKQEFHLEEDNYYTDQEYLEEEEEGADSSVEAGSKKKGRGRTGEPRMKMRRIFRITHGRERQRVKDPDGVLIRYKKILTTYQRVRSMSRAFQIHGVDRNTMASTSPIAEVLLVAPEKMEDVGEFEASKEKLLDYARRCYKIMDEQTHANVQTMKKTHKLLPISYRFRN